MNKYTTINGKIRHAHGPVGRKKYDVLNVELCKSGPNGPNGYYTVPDVRTCRGCGYHVCSCPDVGWIADHRFPDFTSYMYKNDNGVACVRVFLKDVGETRRRAGDVIFGTIEYDDVAFALNRTATSVEEAKRACLDMLR